MPEMGAIHIDRLLETAVRVSATDVFLLPERAPALRCDGELRSLETDVLTADNLEQCVQAVAPDAVRQKLGASGLVQWAFSFGAKARFRARCLRHQTGLELALRCHPLPLRPLEELGLPLIVRALCRRPRGLFLVSGPAGGGKTTVLAALLDYLNQQVGDRRIVTLEPVTEFLHAPARCLVIQQETGPHAVNAAAALRQVISGCGDVLLLGDFTDPAVRRAALDLACRDCLVLAEWPERGTVHALQRWLDEVPATARDQSRNDLAAGLLAILHYELCPRAGSAGLVAARELLVATPRIADCVREGNFDRIPAAIKFSRQYGLCLLDDSLWELLLAGAITPAVALARAREPAQLQERIVRRLRGNEGQEPPPEPAPFPARPRSPPPGLSEHKEPEADN
jgi:twitching motility protein PilT